MINNKILKFAALALLAKFTFADGYDSAYWSSREVVGGVSYTGDKVYNGGQSLGRYKGETADGVAYVLPDLSGDSGTWVTTVRC